MADLDLLIYISMNTRHRYSYTDVQSVRAFTCIEHIHAHTYMFACGVFVCVCLRVFSSVSFV